MSRRRRATILAGHLRLASRAGLRRLGLGAGRQPAHLQGPFPGSSFDGTGSVGPGGAPFSRFTRWTSTRSTATSSSATTTTGTSSTRRAHRCILGTRDDDEVGTTGQSNWSDVAVDNSGGAGGVGEGEQGRIYGSPKAKARRRLEGQRRTRLRRLRTTQWLGLRRALRLRHRLRRRCLGRQLDRWPDLGVQPGRNADRGIVHIGKVRLRHGDRRCRQLLHRRLLLRRSLEIQPHR